jgi:hypothetical protein
LRLAALPHRAGPDLGRSAFGSGALAFSIALCPATLRGSPVTVISPEANTEAIALIDSLNSGE